MEVFAVLTPWTQTPRKEETEVGSRHFIGACVAAVSRDVTASLCLVFAGEGIFAVAAGPFVVPDVEDGACLRWWLGFEEGRVLLGAGGAAFAFDDFRLFYFGYGAVGVGGGGGEFGRGGGW